MWRSWLAQVYVHSHYWHPISSVSWVIILNKYIQQMKQIHWTKTKNIHKWMRYHIYEKFNRYIVITGTQSPQLAGWSLIIFNRNIQQMKHLTFNKRMQYQIHMRNSRSILPLLAPNLLCQIENPPHYKYWTDFLANGLHSFVLIEKYKCFYS